MRTDEEKAAKKITETLNSLTLDLGMVGFYIARYEPSVIVERLETLAKHAAKAVPSQNTSNRTPFNLRCEILSEFWVTYKSDQDFAEFFQLSELGLPLAYATSMDIIQPNPKVEGLVDEAFDLLLAGIGVDDRGFESLDAVLQLMKD